MYFRLLKLEVRNNNIHGIQVARKAPVISHLLFVDDNLLFTRANTKEVDNILEVFQKYQLASGQLVNLDKSKVSFSRNVIEVEAHMIW